MNLVNRPGDVPAEILNSAADVVGAAVAPVGRLAGGANGGAVRVRLVGEPAAGDEAVLKVVPLAHPGQLDEARRARRVVEQLRRQGYPTPAWLGLGATAGHVWQLTEFVDAAPAAELTASLIEQLMDVIELQAGQACVRYDHWAYAWRVATGRDPVAGSAETPEQAALRGSIARLGGFSTEVSMLVDRLRARCARAPAPPAAPDAVHADLATPGNVLVRDGVVVAVVDVGNAGSGTRAIDLTSLLWYALDDPRLDEVRERLWRRIVGLVGAEAAAVLVASHVLHMLEIPVRTGRDDLVPGVVERGRRALAELDARLGSGDA